jgi:2-dehydro-3-deoxyphosphooctonate aldolase (KDO 8-P synthase)
MIINTHKINIAGKCTIGGNARFALIAGPCAIESEEMTLAVARQLREICRELDIPLIFKSSFDKANRTSAKSPRGVGMEKGLQILQKVKTTFDLPVITDVHESWQCAHVARVADMLQIPAFLSRQTDLLIAAAKTGKAVNVKKGQFMAPWDMKNVVEKLSDAGNENILLCERGSSFGYNNLVVDMTGLVEMRRFGFPVVFDATHSVQKPGGQGASTGGNREMVPSLIYAALAVGVDAVFAEVHPDPDHAFSDGPNQLKLSSVRDILIQATAIDNITKGISGRQPSDAESQNETAPQTQKIKLLLTDVDGVLTDAGMYYSEQGDELKKFNARDGMGLQLIKRHNIKTGIITSEETQIVERRYNKLKLDFLVQGKRNGGKLEAAKEICAKEGISLSQVAYIGDDVNCIELLSAVGLAACPKDAVTDVKNVRGIVRMNAKGGEGCVRELVEMIINREKI